MNFVRNRRNLILAVITISFVLVMPVIVYVFLQMIWFEPVRVYAEAQSRSEAVFIEQEWSGYPAWYHYENRVRFICPELNDENVSLLYPIIHSVEGLQSIELDETSLSPEGVAGMKEEFPNCHIRFQDSWF
ncbi:hypothetical protein [Rubinisphaera sp.]|uniref:hypothetical protein n=1 Tax=Rubinisphaera sp. TaxID=2024857 RepID=UPI000C0D4D15|nr:hypothetical protein [Rubinisphaera sp.]MBV12308.1 hypothetical protein [Rubinisphaera sp.]HCS54544.1 hypothetical protein [Planctomycetaceae bacterium]|tara:strand:+ start:137 stop:529 length:393 start_codon:yes stop_codon:yes gene_type:complete